MTLVDLDLFLSKVKLGLLGFWMGKDEKVHFSVAVIVYDMEMQSASARMNVKGQGHSMTLANVTWTKYFNVLFLRNYEAN